MNKNKSPAKSAKKRKTIPLSWKVIENKSLELVASPLGPIQTTAISNIDKDILLDRMRIEIIDKFKFSLSSPSSLGKIRRRRVETQINSTNHRNNDSTYVDELKQNQEELLKDASSNSNPDSTVDSAKAQDNTISLQQEVLRNRIVVGANQCTRVLESCPRVDHRSHPD